MKIFYIIVTCIIGWLVCAVLSAFIGKKFSDLEEEVVVTFSACLAPLTLAIELICIPFVLLCTLVSTIVYRNKE